MTPAVLDRPASLFASEAPEADRARATLEDVLARALHDTRANGSAECPVCNARMSLTRAHAKCGGCGSRLS
jgi:hypothetical protein